MVVERATIEVCPDAQIIHGQGLVALFLDELNKGRAQCGARASDATILGKHRCCECPGRHRRVFSRIRHFEHLAQKSTLCSLTHCISLNAKDKEILVAFRPTSHISMVTAAPSQGRVSVPTSLCSFQGSTYKASKAPLPQNSHFAGRISNFIRMGIIKNLPQTSEVRSFFWAPLSKENLSQRIRSHRT